jgi:hypothetical protein
MDDAISRYESKSDGLGERFFKSFEKTLEKLFRNRSITDI